MRYLRMRRVVPSISAARVWLNSVCCKRLGDDLPLELVDGVRRAMHAHQHLLAQIAR